MRFLFLCFICAEFEAIGLLVTEGFGHDVFMRTFLFDLRFDVGSIEHALIAVHRIPVIYWLHHRLIIGK